MIKEIKCKTCEKVESVTFICDTCGEIMIMPFISVSDVTNPGCLEGLNYHFCSYKCHMNFAISEYSKTIKPTNILFGTKKKGYK